MMTTNSLPYLRIAALTLLGFALGYFMIVLLPAIFATWLGQAIDTRPPADLPHRCEGGDILREEGAPLPGVFEAWIREHLR